MKRNPIKKRILVVDDEEQICNVIYKVLSQAGYDVLTVSSGQEALNTLRKIPVDLMIVDLKMPVMDGLEVFKQARAVQTNLQAIFLTAYGTASSARTAQSLGAHEFLSKPFDNRLLKKVVKESLRVKA